VKQHSFEFLSEKLNTLIKTITKKSNILIINTPVIHEWKRGVNPEIEAKKMSHLIESIMKVVVKVVPLGMIWQKVDHPTTNATGFAVWVFVATTVNITWFKKTHLHLSR
jgi:hypothetical protein